MKRLVFGGIMLLILALFLGIIAGVDAQFIGDQCSVGPVKVENIITDTAVHTKVTYTFNCAGAFEYQGQITKMLVKVPYTDLGNIEASDSFGSMRVLEGPEYIKADIGGTETTIGVIFRESLRITNESLSYPVTIEFDSSSIVTETESVKSLKPAGLAANPKVTIVSKGLTETTMLVEEVDYKLTLPDGAGIQKMTSGCQLDGTVISCNDLTVNSLGDVEVQWIAGSGLDSPMGIVKNVVNKVKDVLPGFADAFKNILGKISDLRK